MKRKLMIIVLTFVLAIGIVGCTNEDSNQPISRTEIFMSTPVSITIYDGEYENILDKAFEKVEEVENLVSINKENTEISELNKNAGIEKVKLSDISYDILKKGLEYSKLSNGSYDITIGPLVKLWNIGFEDAKVPSQDEINEVIDTIDYNNIKINDSTKEVFLKKKGMEIDLGSIAKGYIADEIANILKQEGVNRAIIDLGGNIYALGSKSSDSNWKIGIQNPFNDRGEVVGGIEVSDKTVVTSGIYERFIEENGVKYHHILNPKTGYPYETDIAGVSIITDKSIDADALSTLTFTKGLEEGLKFIEGLDNVDAIFITNDKKIYITENIRDSFKIINTEFEIVN